MNSIVLNGFTLAQTVTPATGAANNANTGIFLTGGVRYLEFHDINAPVDTPRTPTPRLTSSSGDPSNRR